MQSVPYPYCKSALFSCSCCSYSTIIYSDKEWFNVTAHRYCESCKGNCDAKTDQATIYRDDIDEEFPLHMQFCLLPGGKEHCESCEQPNSFIHWTMLLVDCPFCNQETMLFSKYQQGENILDFYLQCLDNTKLAHSPVLWQHNNGDYFLRISWPGNDFSAT